MRLGLRIDGQRKGAAAGAQQTGYVPPPHLGFVVHLRRAHAWQTISTGAISQVGKRSVYQDRPPSASQILLGEVIVVDGAGRLCHRLVVALAPREHPCKALWMLQSKRRQIPRRALPAPQIVEVAEALQHVFPNAGASIGKAAPTTKLPGKREVVNLFLLIRGDAKRLHRP